MSVVIAEGIGLEVADEGVSPAQPGRSRTLLLAQEEKDGGRGCWLGSRCKQAEIAHGVLVAVRDVLREQRDKRSGRARALKQRLRPRVFALVDDFLGGDAKDALLGYGKPPDVAPGISQEMLLRHLPGDVDVPRPLGLRED